MTTPRETAITLRINGRAHSLVVENHWTLLTVLRNSLDLIGAKVGCDRGECGACTVLLDGKPVYACQMLAVQVGSAETLTVEGLAASGDLDPLQQAFIDHDGAQCGFCTSGMLLSAKALLDQNPDPSEADIRRGLSGNICRCTAQARSKET